jgi:hypothetical protein
MCLDLYMYTKMLLKIYSSENEVGATSTNL